MAYKYLKNDTEIPMSIVDIIASYCGPRSDWENFWRRDLNYDFHDISSPFSPDEDFPRTASAAIDLLNQHPDFGDFSRDQSAHWMSFTLVMTELDMIYHLNT
jgi:hypothetical protein